jgi:hypothetical protein
MRGFKQKNVGLLLETREVLYTRDEGRGFREGDAEEGVLYEGWNLEGKGIRKRVRWEAVQEQGFEGRLFRNGVGGEAVQQVGRSRGCSAEG